MYIYVIYTIKLDQSPSMKYVFYFLFLIILKPATAQDFEVSPVIINFNANPGEIQQAKVTIRNHANIKQVFTFNLGDFELDTTSRKVRMAPGTSARSCADWLTISPSFVELKPNEEREITVIVTVPKEKSGSKWSMIYVQASNEQNENPIDKQLATGIKIVPRIVIQVNQSSKINTNYKAKIYSLTEIESETDSLHTYTAIVENTGDKIIEANVQLALANLTTAVEQKFKAKMERVYPGEKKTFTLILPQGNYSTGKYALAAILDYGHNTNLEGSQILIEL